MSWVWEKPESCTSVWFPYQRERQPLDFVLQSGVRLQRTTILWEGRWKQQQQQQSLQLTVSLKFLLTAGGTLFLAIHKYFPISCRVTFPISKTSPLTCVLKMSFPLGSNKRISAFSCVLLGFFCHSIVGVGWPVAEQINLADPPSATLTSLVLCLSEISGGMTTSKVATCKYSIWNKTEILSSTYPRAIY